MQKFVKLLNIHLNGLIYYVNIDIIIIADNIYRQFIFIKTKHKI